MKRDISGESSPLEILGISEGEETLYEWLLTHPGATASEIARANSLVPSKIRHLLDALESKGLITHVPQRPRRYIAAAPDIALKALALNRQESLKKAEDKILELQERATEAKPQEHKQSVELVTSHEAERQVLEQMQRVAQREFISLSRSPTRISDFTTPPERDGHTQREMQAKGIRYRNIVDVDFLKSPGTAARMRSDIEAGEEVRTFPNLPLKLVMADRRIAIIPLNLQRPDGPALIVRSSSLLDALYVLFEMLWERSSPVSVASGAYEIGDTGSQLPRCAETLIPLMAAGMNDKKICDELNIPMRTLTRQISELKASLKTRTRFQTGWVAASHICGSVGGFSALPERKAVE